MRRGECSVREGGPIVMTDYVASHNFCTKSTFVHVQLLFSLFVLLKQETGQNHQVVHTLLVRHHLHPPLLKEPQQVVGIFLEFVLRMMWQLSDIVGHYVVYGIVFVISN